MARSRRKGRWGLHAAVIDRGKAIRMMGSGRRLGIPIVLVGAIVLSAGLLSRSRHSVRDSPSSQSFTERGSEVEHQRAEAPPPLTPKAPTLSDAPEEMGSRSAALGEATISGKVLDLRHAPIPDAHVQASGPSSDYAQTDEDGAYTIRGLAEGVYTVRVSHGDFGTEARKDVVASGEGVHFVLRPKEVISGRVVDAVTLEPIQEFEVAYHTRFAGRMHDSIDESFRAVRDPDGRFVFKAASWSVNAVTVRALGYEPTYRRLERAIFFARGPRQFGPRRFDLLIELNPWAAIQGEVRDWEGSPIAEAKIFFRLLRPLRDRRPRRADLRPRNPKERTPEALTDSRGAFRIEHVPADVRHVITEHPDFLPASHEILPQPGALTKLTFNLQRPGQLEGIVSEGGRALKGVRIEAVSTGSEGRQAPGSAKTDAQGRYTIANLSEGAFRITATVRPSPGPIGEKALEAMALVRQDQVTHVEDFDFEVPSSYVEGIVRQDGSPVDNATIRATVELDDGWARCRAKIGENENGRYRLGPIPAGLAVLFVRTGHQSKLVEFDLARATTVSKDIEFGPAAVVKGTVLVKGSDTYSAIEVYGGRLTLPSQPTTSDFQEHRHRLVAFSRIEKEGTYHIEVSPGHYTIVAMAQNRGMEDRRMVAMHITLEAAAAVECSFDLR